MSYYSQKCNGIIAIYHNVYLGNYCAQLHFVMKCILLGFLIHLKKHVTSVYFYVSDFPHDSSDAFFDCIPKTVQALNVLDKAQTVALQCFFSVCPVATVHCVDEYNPACWRRYTFSELKIIPFGYCRNKLVGLALVLIIKNVKKVS